MQSWPTQQYWFGRHSATAPDPVSEARSAYNERVGFPQEPPARPTRRARTPPGRRRGSSWSTGLKVPWKRCQMWEAIRAGETSWKACKSNFVGIERVYVLQNRWNKECTTPTYGEVKDGTLAHPPSSLLPPFRLPVPCPTFPLSPFPGRQDRSTVEAASLQDALPVAQDIAQAVAQPVAHAVAHPFVRIKLARARRAGRRVLAHVKGAARLAGRAN